MGRNQIIDAAIRHPGAFLDIELYYIACLIEDENRAVSWVKSVGLYFNMVVKNIESKSKLAVAARWSPSKDIKSKLKEEVVTNEKGAVAWACGVPEDKEEVIDHVETPRWVYEWACKVGDIEEMLSRINHKFWEAKIKADAEGEDASFHNSPL